MESWEAELELDVSDIWTGVGVVVATAPAASVVRQEEEDEEELGVIVVASATAAASVVRQQEEEEEEEDVGVLVVESAAAAAASVVRQEEEEEEVEVLVVASAAAAARSVVRQEEEEEEEHDDGLGFGGERHNAQGTTEEEQEQEQEDDVMRNAEEDQRQLQQQQQQKRPAVVSQQLSSSLLGTQKNPAAASQLPPLSLGTQNPCTAEDHRVSSLPSQDSVVMTRKWWQAATTTTRGGELLKRSSKIPGPAGDLRRGTKAADKGGSGRGRGRGGAGISSPSKKGHSCDDDEFERGPWLAALKALDVAEFDPVRYPVLKSTVSAIKASPLQAQVPNFVAVIKELKRNDYGDASVLLKDPTGTIQGCISHKVLSDLKFGSNVGPGAVIILMKVAVFRPSPSAHYLNVTINNVVEVLGVETSLPTQERTSNSNRRNIWSQFQQDILPGTAPSEKICKEPANAPAKTHSEVLAFPDENSTATAAKLAGWDHTDDLEDILNDDLDIFFT